LVPDLTYVATANAVAYTGANPVLVDVEPSTWNISLIDAEEKISENTAAILPVHVYGNPCDMEEIACFAQKHGLLVIEDAAEALGGTWKGKSCGTLGDCGIFSFYADKIITTAEGGMVVSNDEAFIAAVRRLRGQGVDLTRGRYWHEEVGFNYRMTEIQAALGLAQLERLQYFLEARATVVALYNAYLFDVMTVPETSSECIAAPWLFSALVPPTVNRDVLESELLLRGVETRPTFTPLHKLPMYLESDSNFPVSCEIGTYGISLPTHPALMEEDVREICDRVHESVDRCSTVGVHDH
jgi:perosamine synthetase